MASYGYDNTESDFDEEHTKSLLYRFGTSYESAVRLGRKAAEAEGMIGIHGVSVSEIQPQISSSVAPRKDVERHFRVYDTPTRNDPLHRTVELPKPVTNEVAERFNSIFGRKRQS